MAHDDDDILSAKKSHPVTTALLIIGCVALISAITLSVKQLGNYVNPETRRVLNNYKTTAVNYAEGELPNDPAAPDASGAPGRDF